MGLLDSLKEHMEKNREYRELERAELEKAKVEANAQRDVYREQERRLITDKKIEAIKARPGLELDRRQAFNSSVRALPAKVATKAAEFYKTNVTQPQQAELNNPVRQKTMQASRTRASNLHNTIFRQTRSDVADFAQPRRYMYQGYQQQQSRQAQQTKQNTVIYVQPTAPKNAEQMPNQQKKEKKYNPWEVFGAPPWMRQ